MSKSLLTAWSRILKSASWRRIVWGAVLIFSLNFLALKAYDSWDALRTYDWQIRYLYLIPSLALFLIQLVVVVWGWQSIMNRLTQPMPFREHVKIYSYTNLMRRIPAGMILLIAGRAYAYKGQDVPISVSALGSFLEILLVIVTGLPIATLSGTGLGFYSPEAGGVLTIIALALGLVAIHPAVLNRLFRLVRHQALRFEFAYHDTLLWAFIYTLIWLISGTGLFITGYLFADISVDRLPMTIGVWVLASLVSYLTVFSPSGLGVKELSLTLLLGVFLSDPLPLLTALAVRVLWTVYDVLVVSLAILLL